MKMFILSQVFYAFLFSVIYSQTDWIHIQNLDENSFKCICNAVTNCDTNYGCQDNHCGPFGISRDYWADAGKVVLSFDDPGRDPGAYQDCAVQYSCSKKMIKNYMAKYGRDCNDDGVTDCYDYLMIHVNGGIQCNISLDKTEWGKIVTKKFRSYNPILFK